MRRYHILTPYQRDEALTVREAAAVMGRSEATTRERVALHMLGRRVAGGPWQVSKVALAMFLDGDVQALRAYHDGDRASPRVVIYFARCGVTPLAIEATTDA